MREVGSVRGREGFTLVELLLAVTLVGLLAAVAAPRLFGRAAWEERRFQRELAGAVRHARNVAVATGCGVRVSAGAGGYALAQRSGCSTGAFDLPVGTPGRPHQPFVGAPPPGVAVSASADPFVFDALGRAHTSGGAVTDVVLGVGGRTIAVTGETGFVDAS